MRNHLSFRGARAASEPGIQMLAPNKFCGFRVRRSAPSRNDTLK